MVNRLKMVKINAILTLHEQGWSQRKIAEQLGVHRETVARYLANRAKPAKAPAGSDGPGEGAEADGLEAENQPQAPTGSEAENRPQAPTGSAPSRSRCEPYRAKITELYEQGLSARRIYQDLRDEADISYYSIRRFVARLRASDPLPFRRIETEPGQEAQVDFGTGARVFEPTGSRRGRKTYVFRIVLSHSRKAYSEVVFRQTTENFIRCLENAFWHFGGVPRTLVIDNLRAAVTKADWFEPELNPKVEAFCRHYGTVILPTRPRMPRHKGKVERGVSYVKDNALKGRKFQSLNEQNDFLLRWETTIADTRLHGTTRRQVGKCFEEVEKPALQPVPLERFPFFHEAQRTVHRDGHISVESAYYSVPPEYLGKQVWVRWDSRLVRIFNDRLEQVALHAKQLPGKFSTQSQHISDKKIAAVERGTAWYLKRAVAIGPHTEAWATELVTRRGVHAVRVLQGLLQLAGKHSPKALEKACETAHGYGAYRLADVRRLIGIDAPQQQQFDFIQEDPIIRNITDYDELVESAIERQATGGTLS